MQGNAQRHSAACHCDGMSKCILEMGRLCLLYLDSKEDVAHECWSVHGAGHWGNAVGSQKGRGHQVS